MAKILPDLAQLQITVSKLQEIFNRKGYKWFDFHLVGIRKADGKVNQWDDLLGYVWKGQLYFIRATTEPGLDFLRSPMNKAGTGILCEGQYVNAYQLGLHQNRQDHPAFIQVLPVRFFRDNDKDAVIDLDPKTITSGLVGCNIHRSNRNSDPQLVGPHSAMCQVGRNFQAFMKIHKAAQDSGQTRFTYTLLNELDFA